MRDIVETLQEIRDIANAPGFASRSGEPSEALEVIRELCDKALEEMRGRASEAGQVLVEWALMAALVAVVSIAALGFVYKAVEGNLQNIGNSLACPDGALEDGTCAP